MCPQMFILLMLVANRVPREWKTSVWILKSLEDLQSSLEEARLRQVS